MFFIIFDIITVIINHNNIKLSFIQLLDVLCLYIEKTINYKNIQKYFLLLCSLSFNHFQKMTEQQQLPIKDRKLADTFNRNTKIQKLITKETK